MQEPAPYIDIDNLLLDSVAEILRYEDAQRYLDWMQQHFSSYIDDAGPLAFEDISIPPQMPLYLGRAIWNATPLPNNQFKPMPLPEPRRNDPCYCGSGRKYKQCCRQADDFAPPLETDTMMALVAQALPEKQLKPLLASATINHKVLATLALLYLEEGNNRKVQSVLEGVFTSPIRKTGHQTEYLFTLLCNAYDELGYHKKKSALIERILKEAGKSPLRSGAWQRLTVMRMDNGDTAGAWQAFHNAQRDEPDSEHLGVLEVQLLLEENRAEEAAERAHFWVKRLQRRGLDDSPLFELLQNIANNPYQAMMGAESSLGANPALERLQSWIEANLPRPLPEYSVEILADEPGPDGADEDKDSFAPMPSIDGPEGMITPPGELSGIEQKWSMDYGWEKPFSTGMFSHIDEAIWEEEQVDAWLGYLEHNPEAINSLSILDDLINALSEMPQSATPWTQQLVIMPLLEHAMRIVQKIGADHPGIALTWLCLENRPILRLIDAMSYQLKERGEHQQARSYLELGLQLNPLDNQGIRALLINEYLDEHNTLAALQIAERFPDDMLAETVYGKVLAHLMDGDQQAAEDALKTAHQRFPKIADFLTRKRVKQPELSEFGISLGGEDQAWIYRQQARPLWEATPGALEWLKKTVKKLA